MNKILHLEDEESIKELLEQPEDGFGYQLIHANITLQDSRHDRRSGDFLVLNCEYLVPLEGDWPDVITIGELRGLGKEEIAQAVAREGRLPNRRRVSRLTIASGGKLNRMAFLASGGGVNISALTPLPVGHFARPTTAHEVYFRFSAFPNDRRVMPNGDLVPGTFATTYNDLRMVPSGYAAVGRYALPNPLPARYVFVNLPKAGTATIIGAAPPLFGQAGGGVEVQFPNGVVNTPGTAHLIAEA